MVSPSFKSRFNFKSFDLRKAFTARISTAKSAADILRSVVVGDSIWTVSDRAVGRTPAAAPDGVTLIRF